MLQNIHDVSELLYGFLKQIILWNKDILDEHVTCNRSPYLNPKEAPKMENLLKLLLDYVQKRLITLFQKVKYNLFSSQAMTGHILCLPHFKKSHGRVSKINSSPEGGNLSASGQKSHLKPSYPKVKFRHNIQLSNKKIKSLPIFSHQGSVLLQSKEFW